MNIKHLSLGIIISLSLSACGGSSSGSISADTPVDVPVDTPVDVPVDTPVDIPVDEPVDIPVDEPVDIPVDVPTTMDNVSDDAQHIIYTADSVQNNWTLYDCCGGATISNEVDTDNGTVAEFTYNNSGTIAGFFNEQSIDVSPAAGGTLEFDLFLISAPSDSAGILNLKLEGENNTDFIFVPLTGSKERLSPELGVWQHYTFDLDLLSSAATWRSSSLKFFLISTAWGQQQGSAFKLDNISFNAPEDGIQQPAPAPFTPASIRYEAEFTALQGSASIVNDISASSAKQVSISPGVGNGIQIPVSPLGQSLTVGYSSSDSGNLTLFVNDVESGQFSIKGSTGIQTSNLNISIAVNDSIRIENVDSATNISIDYVEFNPQDIALTHFQVVSTQPVDEALAIDHFLALDNGDIYAAGADVTKIDSSGNVTHLNPQDLGATNYVGLAFNSANELHVAAGLSGNVIKLDDQGNWSSVVTGLPRASGLVFNSKGEMFISSFLAPDGSGGTTIYKGLSDGSFEVFATHIDFDGAIGLAIDENDNLYVSGWFSKIISKITPEGVISQLPNAGLTFNQAAHSNGYLYFGDGANIRRLHRIHVDNGTLETFADVGTSTTDGHIDIAGIIPGGTISITPNGKALYTTDNSNNIRKISEDPEKFRFVSTITSSGETADGMNVNSDGDLILSGSKLTQVSLNGESISLDVSNIENSIGLDFDDANNMLIASWGANAIFKRTSDGGVSTFVSGADSPNDVLVGQDGNIYSASCGEAANGYTVNKYSPAGDLLSQIALETSGFSCVSGITQDELGIIYASNWHTGKIYRIENENVSILATLTNDFGAAVNVNHIIYAKGHIYAPTADMNLIHRIDKSGNIDVFSGSLLQANVNGHISIADFNNPHSITVANNGDALYLVNGDGDVKVISSYILP